MTLGGYFMSNSVFVPALIDSLGSTFKDKAKVINHRSMLSAAKCRPITLVSGNIRCIRIFAGVSQGLDIKRQWGCQEQVIGV